MIYVHKSCVVKLFHPLQEDYLSALYGNIIFIL